MKACPTILIFVTMATVLTWGGNGKGAEPEPGLTAVTTALPHWRVRLAAITSKGQIAAISGATVQSWRQPGDIIMQSGGQTLRLATAQLLSLRRSVKSTAAVEPAISTWWLHLRTGDVFPGKPVASKSGKLTFCSAVFGGIHIPWDQIAALSRRRAVMTVNKSIHDHLRFRNGDRLSGAMLKFSRQRVQWKSMLGTISIPLARIAQIKLAQTLRFPIPRGPRIRITYRDGTVITATKMDWQGTHIRLNPVGLAAVSCGVADVTKIDILGGHLIWLTTLTPQQYIQIPYVGDAWPLEKDKNCIGETLRADGRVFAHGLGLQVAATLTYALAGRYTQLTFIPAMDHTARPWGTATVSVWADGKRLFVSKLLKPGAALHPVSLKVAGVRLLKFKVDGGTRFGVRGRVDLLDAALLK
ncbi:MAG: NPCBM/NEW2 domain-containing protein [Phycisphaerae bacterium]